MSVATAISAEHNRPLMRNVSRRTERAVPGCSWAAGPQVQGQNLKLVESLTEMHSVTAVCDKRELQQTGSLHLDSRCLRLQQAAAIALLYKSRNTEESNTARRRAHHITRRYDGVPVNTSFFFSFSLTTPIVAMKTEEKEQLSHFLSPSSPASRSPLSPPRHPPPLLCPLVLAAPCPPLVILPSLRLRQRPTVRPSPCSTLTPSASSRQPPSASCCARCASTRPRRRSPCC